MRTQTRKTTRNDTVVSLRILSAIGIRDSRPWVSRHFSTFACAYMYIVITLIRVLSFGVVVYMECNMVARSVTWLFRGPTG